MTAPERIWLQDNGDFDAASDVTWCQHRIEDNDTEYVRADLAAVPTQVKVKPLVALVDELTTAVWHLLDNSETSGPIDDPTITVWQPDFDTVSSLLDRIEGLSSGSNDDMTAGELLSANILAAIESQPDPRDEVIGALVEAATHLCDGIATMLPPLGQSDRVLNLRAALAAAKVMQQKE